MPVSPSYRNQSIDLLCKSIDWFLYDGNFELMKATVGNHIQKFCPIDPNFVKVKEKFYIDDLNTSAYSLDEDINLCKKLKVNSKKPNLFLENGEVRTRFYVNLQA